MKSNDFVVHLKQHYPHKETQLEMIVSENQRAGVLQIQENVEA